MNGDERAPLSATEERPTIGALVEVRGQRWVVGEVDDVASLGAAELADAVSKKADRAELVAREQRRRWLATDQVHGSFDRHPIHWPLAFPEVFASHVTEISENGESLRQPKADGPGFDAIIGNPPFLGGQKLTGTMGVAYREYLVEAIGRGARGSADLVAYFLLRAHDLLNKGGQAGLIATNTLAQGDTREVGLDQLVQGGVAIRQAVKSKPWPSRSAVLEYCVVWSSRVQPGAGAGAKRFADGVEVPAITPSLDPMSRVTGNPRRLLANTGRSFQGSNILGLGFTMEPDAARAMIERDPRNREVLFPYLNGQDLNSRPDTSGSRWVINFRDWEKGAAETYAQVLEKVKPERDANKYSKTARDRWWLFERARPELYGAIAGLRQVVVITLVSKVVMPVMVPTGQVFSHMLGVFATDDTAMLALLSSAPH
ncbi:DNA methyltransferase [Streptosporangium sp. NPDC006930]|uniref:Eco57I restriction-modification methylase domain-containing protein n=1 Tax=unclassified Streptosporangium TaxID=2632669 RepID=UPI00343CB77F